MGMIEVVQDAETVAKVYNVYTETLVCLTHQPTHTHTHTHTHPHTHIDSVTSWREFFNTKRWTIAWLVKEEESKVCLAFLQIN